ncbi:hypothetical protein [Mesorhizobium sp. B263B2A]|uniref:hypothetical protein n=1 Tax=Mesorhizobium sp. B263B2A TaxID=2876669 RepID=UPI001CD0CDD7|nr:hypothetical protein [Mesorhizobium sp. B263B2A]MCA0033017.1 hypothetical protein [Mesorhizobium sp. B263B2A]
MCFCFDGDTAVAAHRPDACREHLPDAPPHHRSIAGEAQPARPALPDERKVIQRWAEASGVTLRG